jgi:mRNA interferase RelE/StbE
MKSEKLYKILLHARVPSEIKAIPSTIRDKIKNVIDNLAADPVPRMASKLQGRIGCYRIRVGDYRIIYEVHATEVVVYIIGVGHRREVYRHILRRK